MGFVLGDMGKGGAEIGLDQWDRGWRWECASWHGLMSWKRGEFGCLLLGCG